MEYTDALQTLFDLERDLQREGFTANGWQPTPSLNLDGMRWEKKTLPFTVSLAPQFNSDSDKWDCIGITFINKLTSSEFELSYSYDFGGDPTKLFEEFKQILNDLFFSL